MADVRAAADAAADSAYAVDKDLRLTYTNAAWDEFARANGGEAMLPRWVVGARVTDAIQGPLHAFFTEAFSRAIATRTRFELDYECGSAMLGRRYRMIAYPLLEGGLLVSNSRIVEAPRSEPAYPPIEELYVSQGYVTQCGHCRRVQHKAERSRWDWVPHYVSQPRDKVSHSLCPPCVEVYYPPRD